MGVWVTIDVKSSVVGSADGAVVVETGFEVGSGELASVVASEMISEDTDEKMEEVMSEDEGARVV